MASPKSSNSAFLALALSGGLWAWQNRDKIGGWIKQQTTQLQQSTGNTPQAPSKLESAGQPYTDATRRINESEIGTQPGFNSGITSTENPNTTL